MNYRYRDKLEKGVPVLLLLLLLLLITRVSRLSNRNRKNDRLFPTI